MVQSWIYVVVYLRTDVFPPCYRCCCDNAVFSCSISGTNVGLEQSAIRWLLLGRGLRPVSRNHNRICRQISFCTSCAYSRRCTKIRDKMDKVFLLLIVACSVGVGHADRASYTATMSQYLVGAWFKCALYRMCSLYLVCMSLTSAVLPDVIVGSADVSETVTEAAYADFSQLENVRLHCMHA